jgi:hypothetical protein
VIAEIVERADRVPLSVEEMTKAILEAGAERGREIAAAVPLTNRLMRHPRMRSPSSQGPLDGKDIIRSNNGRRL